MRGRSRGKGPNPLTRAYESNGPDVKIRGTAQHIADKYAQLARDAQASGDPVAAENYLQHGEHYFRLIAAAQEQYRLQYGVTQRFDEDGEEVDEDAPAGYGAPAGDRSGDEFGEPQGYAAPQPDMRPYEPRGDRPQQQPRFDNRGGDRQNRNQRFDRPNGGYDRPNGERFDRPNGGGERFDRANGPDRFQGDRQGGPDRPRPDRPDGRFNRNEGREGTPFAGPREPRQDVRPDREPRPDREFRPDREPRPEREPRPDREPRPEIRADREPRPERPPFRPEPARAGADEPPAGDLPAFLMNPIRPVIPAPEAPEAGPAALAGDSAPIEVNGARPARRRRTRKAEIAEEAADGPEPADTAAE